MINYVQKSVQRISLFISLNLTQSSPIAVKLFFGKTEDHWLKSEEYLREEGKHASLSQAELPHLFLWNKLEKPQGYSILWRRPQAPDLGPD